MTLRLPVDAPVHRGEQQHIDAGQGAAWDVGKWGDPIYAPEDMLISSGTGSDPHIEDGAFHAGNVVVAISTDPQQQSWQRHHFCHLQSLDVHQEQYVARGEVIGHVGSTGSTYDAQGNVGTVAAAHCHYWVEQWIDGAWQRVWPSTLDWASESDAPAPGATSTTEAGMQSLVDSVAAVENSIRESLDDAWKKLDAIQQHPEATQAIIDLAEGVKQDVVVRIKATVGLK